MQSKIQRCRLLTCTTENVLISNLDKENSWFTINPKLKIDYYLLISYRNNQTTINDGYLYIPTHVIYVENIFIRHTSCSVIYNILKSHITKRTFTFFNAEYGTYTKLSNQLEILLTKLKRLLNYEENSLFFLFIYFLKTLKII